MASSSTALVVPLLQPSSGEGLEAPLAVLAASTEGMVDAPMASPPVPGESVPAPPSFVSGKAEDLDAPPLDGFSAFPLSVDPGWAYESSVQKGDQHPVSPLRPSGLQDPGYASSPLFPLDRSVSELLFDPVEDWDWTVSGLEPTISGNPTINFDFLCAASKDWSHWVDREILDPDFWDRLVDAGVHWSILISRSCNMFRDTESLREMLRRWCPSTHTFFFSWGELTPTLEDVANHWMLPILGEYSLSNIKLSAVEEETAAALRKRSSTRLSGWPSFFVHQKDASVRRAAFVFVLAMISAGHCFPLAPLFLGHLYSQLDLLHDCEIQGDSCYILSAAFNTSALQTFFWEHSVSYTFAARDKSAAWSRFSDLPREFLEHFPDFRDNLPLVYRWVGLKTHDHDLVDALDYEEDMLFRPYGDDYPGFTCASIFRKFYRLSPLIRDLKVDDYRSLSYLSTVNPGFLPILSATGVSFIPYCPQRVQRQFGLDQGIPIGPQETATCVADLTAFLKSRSFVRWGGETTRVLIPGGHRLGYNTPSMGAYWQRFTQSMVDFVIAGRSDKTPMSVHRRPLVSNPYLAPPSQSAISYANSQKLGFAEWDESRGGWIAYTIHLPEGWRNSVNVVEDRLIMLSKRAVEERFAECPPLLLEDEEEPSKRGKGSKRDAPADLAIEKTPKKPTPSVPSSKKAPSKKAKAVKKDKPPLLVPFAAKESIAALVQESTKFAIAPLRGRQGQGKKESTTAPVEEPAESTVAPSKPKSVGASSPSKKSAASSPPRGQKKTNVSSSSPDEEEPSAVSTPSPPWKKKFTAPLFPLGVCWPYEEQDLRQVTHGSSRSVDSVLTLRLPLLLFFVFILGITATVDQDEDLRKSTADSSKTGDKSMGEEHSSSSDSFFDSTPGSVPKDQIVFRGSTADDDDMAEADDSSMGATGSMEEDLAIVPHAGHVHDDDSTVDADVDPIFFSLPQTVLTSAGSDISIAHVMEGISLFGVTPSLRAIPAGGFVIPASHLTSEASPVVGGALMPEETPAQGLIESESVVDPGVDAAGHDAPIEDAGVSAVDAFAGSNHLENIGVDDTVHVLEDVGEIGTTGEVTAVSPPPRPTIEAGSSVGVGGLSSEVVDFLKEFDAKAPNPHPEQYFWSFNGPLVPFGDFWVPNDCSPYLSWLSAGHGDFTKGFKLSIGLGGPMLSLLGSVLAAMSESSLEDVTTTRILAWRSVIQDLMDVGFDLGFMIERLRQTAQCLFGKRLADEIKVLQHQIALLQDSLAELTAYQNEIMSTGRMVPRSGRGGSFLDSLLD
uniref:Aminotransferase-like plant mobile domain-containing protein n=1 Tax=Fagus sylvatica TaxID=28930 RepID=A0A2N9FTQ0_FAGSY